MSWTTQPDPWLKVTWILTLSCGHEVLTDVRLDSSKQYQHYILCIYCVNGKEEYLDRVEEGLEKPKALPLSWANLVSVRKLNDLYDVQSGNARVLCRSILRLPYKSTLFPYCPKRIRRTFR